MTPELEPTLEEGIQASKLGVVVLPCVDDVDMMLLVQSRIFLHIILWLEFPLFHVAREQIDPRLFRNDTPTLVHSSSQPHLLHKLLTEHCIPSIDMIVPTLFVNSSSKTQDQGCPNTLATLVVARIHSIKAVHPRSS